MPTPSYLIEYTTGHTCPDCRKPKLRVWKYSDKITKICDDCSHSSNLPKRQASG